LFVWEWSSLAMQFYHFSENYPCLPINYVPQFLGTCSPP
jgi:hypothetical protein